MGLIEGVTLARGPCYATCSVHRVTLGRDGRAQWEGESFTDRLGTHRRRFDPVVFERLISAIERSGFYWEDAPQR
jgi:Domain of unknown function (DUF6438)